MALSLLSPSSACRRGIQAGLCVEDGKSREQAALLPPSLTPLSMLVWGNESSTSLCLPEQLLPLTLHRMRVAV